MLLTDTSRRPYFVCDKQLLYQCSTGSSSLVACPTVKIIEVQYSVSPVDKMKIMAALMTILRRVVVKILRDRGSGTI